MNLMQQFIAKLFHSHLSFSQEMRFFCVRPFLNYLIFIGSIGFSIVFADFLDFSWIFNGF